GSRRDPRTVLVLRRARPAQRASTPTLGGYGGSSPHASEAREINTVGRRKTRGGGQRGGDGRRAQTGATRPTRQYADPRGGWGVVPPRERSEGNQHRRKAEDAAGADAIRARSWFSDGRDPPNAPVRRHSGGMGGRPPTRAKRGKSTQSEVGSRKSEV